MSQTAGMAVLWLVIMQLCQWKYAGILAQHSPRWRLQVYWLQDPSPLKSIGACVDNCFLLNTVFVRGWNWGVRSPGELLPTAPSGDDGSNAEDAFRVLWDVTIAGTLTVTLSDNADYQLIPGMVRWNDIWFPCQYVWPGGGRWFEEARDQVCFCDSYRRMDDEQLQRCGARSRLLHLHRQHTLPE